MVGTGPIGERVRAAAAWLFGRPYLLLTLTSLFWAGNVIVGRMAAGHIPPVALSVLRWTGAFLILLPFAWRQLRRDWPAIRAHLGIVTVLTISGISTYNTTTYFALKYTQAINGLLIQSTGPFLIALWTYALFGERLSARQAGGVMVSLAGVLVIICRGDLDALLAISFNLGDVLFLVALIVFAFYAALSRRRPAVHPTSFLAFTMGWGALWLLPALAWEMAASAVIRFDAPTLGMLGYVMLFPSLLAYLFFNRGVELVGPNRAAPFFHLIPVFGSVMAIALLGERLQAFHLAGYGLVLAGIVVATRR